MASVVDEAVVLAHADQEENDAATEAANFAAAIATHVAPQRQYFPAGDFTTVDTANVDGLRATLHDRASAAFSNYMGHDADPAPFLNPCFAAVLGFALSTVKVYKTSILADGSTVSHVGTGTVVDLDSVPAAAPVKTWAAKHDARFLLVTARHVLTHYAENQLNKTRLQVRDPVSPIHERFELVRGRALFFEESRPAAAAEAGGAGAAAPWDPSAAGNFLSWGGTPDHVRDLSSVFPAEAHAPDFAAVLLHPDAAATAKIFTEAQRRIDAAGLPDPVAFPVPPRALAGASAHGIPICPTAQEMTVVFSFAHPLGFKKRVSIASIGCRDGLPNREFPHGVPTYGGSSGALLLGLKMKSGDLSGWRAHPLEMAGFHFARTSPGERALATADELACLTERIQLVASDTLPPEAFWQHGRGVAVHAYIAGGVMRLG